MSQKYVYFFNEGNGKMRSCSAEREPTWRR